MIVFLTGGTGYMGRALVPRLLERGHEVRALVRQGSERKLPEGCEAVPGNVLDGATFAGRVRGAETWVHLVGVPQAAPWKADQFRAFDLPSVRVAAEVARAAGIGHFVYVSVAQPAPVMKAYIAVRAECEGILRASGLHVTFLRPWYVLGPAHWWPLALKPLYWLMEQIPSTRETATRLGLVNLAQMTGALLWAVENPGTGVRILEVPEIGRHKA